MAIKIGLLYITAHESGFQVPFSVWYEQMLQQIEMADRAGLHGIWVAEHRIPGYALASPPVFLSAAAARTRRIRLGTAVCLVSLHHPVQTAEDYATLDVLSGGRLDFGAGRGQFPYDFAVAGVDLNESRERFDENLDAVLRLWTEETVEFRGKFFQFDHRMLPKPVQQPRPPVYVAAARTPASYPWAGERGFHLMIAPLLFADLDVLRRHLAAYRAAATANGHDPAGLDLVAAYPFYCGERSEDVAQAADPHLVRLARYNAFSLFAGLDCIRPGAFNEFLAKREAGTLDDGLPAGSTSRDWQAWKQGRALFGPPDQIVEQINRVVEDHGINYVVLEVFYGGQSHRDMMKSLERLATRVLPHLDLAPPPSEIVPPLTDFPVERC